MDFRSSTFFNFFLGRNKSSRILSGCNLEVVKKKMKILVVVEIRRDRPISLSYSSLKNLTIREEKLVNIPNPA